MSGFYQYKGSERSSFFSYYESVSSGGISKSTTANQIENKKKKEDFNKLKSLSMFTSTDTMAAKVYMLSFSRGNIFDSYSQPNLDDFFELRFLRKRDDEFKELPGQRENVNPFRIGLTQYTTSAYVQVYCKDIQKVDFFDGEKKMHFLIERRPPKKEFVIKFHYYHDYEVLKKKLKSILILEGREEYEKVSFHQKYKGKGTNKAIQKTYSLSNRLSTTGIYHKIEYRKWKKKQHKKWFQRIFIFDRSEKNLKHNVKTVNQFLSQYFPKVYKELITYLEKEDNNLVLLMEELLASPDVDLSSVLSLEKNKPEDTENLKYLSKILIQHIRTLEHLDVGESKYFSKPYFRVFEKILKHSEIENRDQFQRVFYRVRFDDIVLWDYEELRDWILVLILFNTPLQIRRRNDQAGSKYQQKKDLITHFEESFEKFCMAQLGDNSSTSESSVEKEELEGEGFDDDDDDDDDNGMLNMEEFLETPSDKKVPWEEKTLESKIPADRFDDFLKEYNRINGFEIKNISFPFRYKIRRNEKRKEMLKLTQEIRKLKRENRRMRTKSNEFQKRLGELHDENETLMTDLMLKIDDDEFMVTAPIRMEELETDIQKLEDERAELKKQMEKNLKKVKKIEEKDLDQCRFDLQLLQCPQNSEGEWVFLRSQARRDEIRKLIDKRLEFLRKEYGVLELVVKVVLSRFKEAKAKGYQKRLMKVINPILSPKFFTFGFIHSSVLVKNCGFHWLSNELITVKDLDLSDGYEDVFCVDAHCPILFNNMKQLIDVVEGLSLNLVDWNARTKYSSWGGPSSIIPSSGSSMNCQEATIKIVEKLEFTKFFKEVWSYVNQMKQRVDEGHKNLRFLNIKTICNEDGNSAESKFVKAFDKDVLKGRKIIEFERHRDLDEFVIDLKKVDKNLRLNWPGVWQLLKAFDRSFWMISMKNSEDEVTKESRLLCPFKAQNIRVSEDSDYSM